jgi:hypothetical protein
VDTEPHGKLANIIAKYNDIQNGCTLTYTMCWWHIEHANQQGANSQHGCTHHYQWCNFLYYRHVVVTEPHGKLANIIAKHNDMSIVCTPTYTMCWWHIEHANQQGPISQHGCTHHYQWCNSPNYRHVVETKHHDKLANIIAKYNDIQNGCTPTYTMCW